jgi:hypothetical protein
MVLPPHAENLKQQVSGVWTLTSGSEQVPDGSKKVPWSGWQLDPRCVWVHVVLPTEGPKKHPTRVNSGTNESGTSNQRPSRVDLDQ